MSLFDLFRDYLNDHPGEPFDKEEDSPTEEKAVGGDAPGSPVKDGSENGADNGSVEESTDALYSEDETLDDSAFDEDEYDIYEAIFGKSGGDGELDDDDEIADETDSEKDEYDDIYEAIFGKRGSNSKANDDDVTADEADSEDDEDDDYCDCEEDDDIDDELLRGTEDLSSCVGCLLSWLGDLGDGIRDRLRAAFPEEKEEKAEPVTKSQWARTVMYMAICLLVMGGIALYLLKADNLRAMMSVKQLEVSGNVYSISFSGDYGLDDLLDNGGVKDESDIGEFLGNRLFLGIFGKPEVTADGGESSGSFFSAENSVSLRGTLVGRNSNSSDEQMMLTVVSRPEYGYSSVSTVNLSAMGYTPYDRPNLFSRYDMLAAIYLPVDGMNSSGLCVAALALPDAPAASYNTVRPDITVTVAVRLLLDGTRSVEGAVALLEQYDVHPSFYTAYQLAVCDSSGKSVIIEWVDGEMKVTESNYATNHSLTVPRNDGITDITDSAARLEKLSDTYKQYGGALSSTQVFNTMESVAPDNDGWMVVFDNRDLTASYCFNGEYDKRFTVSLD